MNLFDIAEQKLKKEQKSYKIDDYSGLDVIETAIRIRRKLDLLNYKKEYHKSRRIM